MKDGIEEHISFSDEIKWAKKNQKPIVALESTIISHGMPFPENYDTAIQAEKLVREANVTPATMAVINGKIKIGLLQEEIKHLSKSKKVQKLSTNNISMSIVKKSTGTTTVAATLILAHYAKIPVFATGGIGGAHRGSEKNFDISADLKQLASSPINLVCAGPKAILDIPKTIELLESLGVPLITFKNKNVPAFWSRDSGINSPIVTSSVTEIVESYYIRSRLGLIAGQLICNPIPKKFEIEHGVIEPVIRKAMSTATKMNIQGKQLTPFLLSQILQKTSGKSLNANKELLFNNIDLATKIANTLSLKNNGDTH